MLREAFFPRPPPSCQNIFTWCGGKSNILERNKARDLALAIRDSERQGKARVEIVSDGEEPAEMIQVGGLWGWEASAWELGDGCDPLGARGWSVEGWAGASWPLLLARSQGASVWFRVKYPCGRMDQWPGRWGGRDPALICAGCPCAGPFAPPEPWPWA